MDALFSGPWGPIIIFCLRIGDVSLSTLRILLSMKNQKILVPIIGVIEVTIWIFAVGNAIRHLDSAWHVAGYALGFGTGSLVGMLLEEKLAIGMATMQIITRKTTVELAATLRALGCGVTEFVGSGREGRVEVLYTVLPRRRIPEVVKAVERFDPDAFITLDEPRDIRRGWMQPTPRRRMPAGLRVAGEMQKVAERKLRQDDEPPPPAPSGKPVRD